MRQMEKSVRLRLAEKLDDKTEYSVAHHIKGVAFPPILPFTMRGQTIASKTT